MKSPLYMTFSGGGTYGLMYHGMYRALRRHLPLACNKTINEMFDEVRGFAGVSIGALVALAFCLNMTDDAYETLFGRYENITELMPRTDFAQLLQNYGLDRGDNIRLMIRDVLRSAAISELATFADMTRLIKRDFVCIATNLQTQMPIHFSAATTPNALVADAVYMSMCVPFLFTPMHYDGDCIVDGCMSCHMPSVFDDDETLFVDFDLSEMRLRVQNIQDYCVACLTCKETNRWYLEKECLLLQVPRRSRTHPCDFSQDIALQRATCGYASTLAHIYPSFMPVLAQVFRLTYDMVLARKQQQTSASADEEDMCAAF